MSRAGKLLVMLEDVSSQLIQTAKITGIKDDSLAATFDLSMGDIFYIGPDPDKAMLGGPDSVEVSLEDIMGAFEFEIIDQTQDME